MMKNKLRILPASVAQMMPLILVLIMTLQAKSQQVQPRVLIFSKTASYHHESITAGVKAIQQLGARNGFNVDTTTNPALFSEPELKKYAAVVFLSTSGKLLDSAQKGNFMHYIQSGGGYMGIHSASATEKEWVWYGRLVGAVFTDHPEPQTGYIKVTNRKHASTRHLPARFQWKDEWYNFKKVPTGVQVLLCADETSYQGGKNGSYHPLAWYHLFDGGRAFYTALGHFDESYTNPLYLNHLLGGIQYAMGLAAKPNLRKAKMPS